MSEGYDPTYGGEVSADLTMEEHVAIETLHDNIERIVGDGDMLDPVESALSKILEDGGTE